MKSKYNVDFINILYKSNQIDHINQSISPSITISSIVIKETITITNKILIYEYPFSGCIFLIPPLSSPPSHLTVSLWMNVTKTYVRFLKVRVILVTDKCWFYWSINYYDEQIQKNKKKHKKLLRNVREKGSVFQIRSFRDI